MPPRAAHADADSFLSSAMASHQGPLLRYATRLLGDHERARDVVQDTFMRLHTQPRASVVDHLAEWLFTVCRHRAMDVLRKEGRARSFGEREFEQLSGTEPRPGRRLEMEERREQLRRLVDGLPPNLQEVVRLRFQDGFSYKQISGITGLSVTNVGFLLHTAVQRLRRQLTDQPE